MITILMATYNGENFINEQMDSLLNQSFQDFKIVITDDCSTDNTLKILKEYENKYPQKIKVISNDFNSGSAKFNFIKMMIEYKDDYIMLCDQDDVWLKDKIKITYEKVRKMESIYGKNIPILVHTDLKVVDENLNVISESLIKMMNADYSKTKLKNQIVQNTLTGCTVMYNKSLANLIKTEPEYMVMHDWWLMLIASAFGKIDYLNETTILYRQHSCNEVGTRNMKSIGFILKFATKSKKIKTALEQSCLQAKSFLMEYDELLGSEDKYVVREYADLPNKNKFMKLLTIFKIRTFKNGFVRIIGQLLYI